MIDWLVNRIFRFTSLREAIFEEVHMYDHLSDVFTNSDLTDVASCSWMEGDMWYGWNYDSNAKRYYFDDIGSKSLIGLCDNQWLRKADEIDPEKKINAWASEQIKIAKVTGEVPF